MALNNPTILGEILRRLRIERGISIEQLADYMDVKLNEITDMEDGNSDCSIRILFDYMHALSLTIFIIKKKYVTIFNLCNPFAQLVYKRKKKKKRETEYMPIIRNSYICYYDRNLIDNCVKDIQNDIFGYLYDKLTIKEAEEKTGMDITEIKGMKECTFMTLHQLCRVCNALKVKIIITQSDYILKPTSLIKDFDYIIELIKVILFAIILSIMSMIYS